MAEPSVIASVKASATRARVTPRLKNSAPERASVITAASTAGGEGSFAAPVSSEAIHQVAMKTTKDRRRSTSVSRDRLVEGAGIELRRGADQFAAADTGQHAIEHARIGFLVGDRAPRHALAIPVAVGA